MPKKLFDNDDEEVLEKKSVVAVVNHTKSLNKLTSKFDKMYRNLTKSSLEAKEEHEVFKKGDANNTKNL